MEKLKEKYFKKVIPELKSKFGYQNNLAVPKITKVVVNVGIGKSRDDQKFIEQVENNLKRITGQKPIYTLSKKSISAFKVRIGDKVGLKITLRGKRMYDFLDKLVNVTFPRLRDFQGINPKKSIDQQGNLNIGFKEHIVFPEISSDEVEKIHGLEVAVVTNANDWEKGYQLLKSLNFPFKEVKSGKL